MFRYDPVFSSAQLHGGHVEAESEVGRGTTIRVTLPLNRPVNSSH